MTWRRVAGGLAAVALTAAAAPPDDPLVDQQWHLPHIGTFAAWDVGQGDGIVVAVVDTGVDHEHPDLEGRLTQGVDLVDRGTPPDDPNGHGTIVAGIVAATAGNRAGGSGVAPLARIMPVRVLDAEGEGSSRTVAEGIRWAAEHEADVINVSLADAPGQTQGMASLITTDVELAIRDASREGAVVVVAAGNEGRTRTPYRSGLPALVVGASDREDQPWRHSNRDDRTLFAPGVEIVSTYRGGQYVKAAGTSFAAPVVAGAAAILVEQGLDQRQARNRLVHTAQDIGVGSGRLDLAAAADADQPRPAPSPTTAQPTPDPGPEPAGPPSEPVIEPIEEPSPPGRDGPPEPGTLPEPQPEPDPEPMPEPEPEDEQPVLADPPVTQEPLDGAGAQPPPATEPLPSWPVGLASVLLALNLVGLTAALGGRRS